MSKMAEKQSEQEMKNLVAYTLANTLLDFDVNLARVESRLLEKYSSDFVDFWDNPGRVCGILRRMYPKRYPQISSTILEKLDGFIPRVKYSEFQMALG